MRSTTLVFNFVVVLMCVSSAASQQSGFQSGNGQTSIYLESGSAATFNFGDTKASIGHISHHTTRALIWGYEIFGKASSGVTTLFSSKIKVPEGGADLMIGLHPFSHSTVSPTKDNWGLLDLGYSRSEFYVAGNPEPVDNARHSFDRFRALAAYNAKLSDHVLGAIALGAERRNNLDDLTQVTFETIVAPAVAGTTTSIVKTKDGFFGNYRQYVGAPIYTDLLLILPRSIRVPGFDSQIALDGFTRSDVAPTNRSADGGIGIFLTKKGSPTKVLGGIAGSWNDGKGRLALVASYNF